MNANVNANVVKEKCNLRHQQSPPSIPRSLKLTPKKFQSLVQFKCLRALVDPGEAIGLLASQVRVQGSLPQSFPQL